MKPQSKIPEIEELSKQRLIFVNGKGGVGKTTLSQALALHLSSIGKKTLWVTIEDPNTDTMQYVAIQPNLQAINLDPVGCFEEYAALKIGVPTLTKIFIENSVVRFLVQVSPGMKELLLLGKIWFLRQNFDAIVVDMPSTGHGLVFFQSVFNFSKLFRGSTLQRDADAMLETLSNPSVTSFVITTLAEEMPLRESLELAETLRGFFPSVRPFFAINKKLPELNEPIDVAAHSPLPASIEDYLRCRSHAEANHLHEFLPLLHAEGKTTILPFLIPNATTTKEKTEPSNLFFPRSLQLSRWFQ